jgi:DNA end-binding protein Ku
MEALKASVAAAKRGEKPRPAKKSSQKKKASKGAESSEDLAGMTKTELDKRAKELGISGRSKMDKKALIKAIQKAA